MQSMQVAEEEEDRCDQAEDKKPPTEEVREAIMIWSYSKIVFIYFFFLILNDLGVWGAIASMRVLLVCPSDMQCIGPKKIWSISRYATQWSECSSKCSDMMGLQSRSDHQSLNTFVVKNCLKSNLNYMTVSSTISIEGLRFSQDCFLWNHWWQRDCYKY